MFYVALFWSNSIQQIITYSESGFAGFTGWIILKIIELSQIKVL